MHRFQRASASELRNLLPDHINSTLMHDLETMIDWRDLLAHRYRLKKVVDDSQRQFAADTAGELIRVHSQFVDLTERITAKTDETMASLPSQDGQDDLREMFVSLARPILFGEPLPPPNAD